MVERIQLLCQERGITVAELERTLNFSKGAIWKWSNSSPSVDNILKVAEFFNISIYYLVNREEPVINSILTRSKSELPPDAIKELNLFIEFLKMKNNIK